MAHLLIVDDDPATARSLGRVLRAAGHRITIAGSCKEARALEGAFDCAVFDIDLGDGDGIDLANELQTRGSIGKIVFYSGTPDGAVLERVSGRGPLVVKAEPVARLLEEVEKLLDSGRAPAGYEGRGYAPAGAVERSGKQR